MPDAFPESEEERTSRLLLSEFLTTTDLLLQRFLQTLILDVHSIANRAGTQLRRIWAAAQESLSGVTKSVDIGLSRTRREALNTIGMFGDTLRAKWELLAFDIREGSVKRVMKRLNSMLGSLAKVFPALHAAKEFKDHVEATIDGISDVPEFVALGDLL